MATSTRTELQAEVAAVVTAAQEIITNAVAGEYTSSAEYEADVLAVRRKLATLIPALEAEWGVSSIAVVVALRALAARMTDLRATIADPVELIEFTVDRVVSLMELAAAWYDDVSQWRDLRDLNPGIRHPGFVAPGTVVVRHAR